MQSAPLKAVVSLYGHAAGQQATALFCRSERKELPGENWSAGTAIWSTVQAYQEVHLEDIQNRLILWYR